MAVVRIPDKLSGMTVGNRSTIVINAVNNRAVQVGAGGRRYSLRHPVVSTVKDAG